MMGATDPKKSAPGTIRGDLAIALGENVVHGSDSPASAERELQLFFARRPAALSDPRPPLVLASRSPQRRALLTQLQLPFRVAEPDYDEPALPVAAGRARPDPRAREGRSVATAPGDGPVLGVDTAVVLDGDGARQAAGRRRGARDAGAPRRPRAPRR